MPRGVIEYGVVAGRWFESVYSLEELFEGALEDWSLLRYRYRLGSRAVMLWPESEMGEAIDL